MGKANNVAVKYLEVLNYGLFGRPRRFVSLGFRRPHAECLAEVGVDGVVGLPLSLRWGDPIDANVVPLLLPEVLSLKIVDRILWLRIESELAQGRFPELTKLLIVFFRPALALLKNFVNILFRYLQVREG